MAVVKVKRYNGMEFRDLVVSSSTVKTEVAVSVNDKIVVERPLTLQLHKNAYRYEPELLLSTWSFEYPKIVSRGTVSSTYWRSEISFVKLATTVRTFFDRHYPRELIFFTHGSSPLFLRFFI